MPKNKGRKRILNCLPSRDVERDWRFEHALQAGLLSARAVLPPSKDLRAAWWTIGDQGSTGSCVGWASADGVLRWHFARKGLLRKATRLSTRFQWMAAKETDVFTSYPSAFIESDGTSLKAALDVARKFGAVPDPVLPFASGRLYQDEAETFYATAAQFKIASYFNLGPQPDRWKAWLASKGPLLTRLDVDATWDDANRNHGLLDTYLPDTTRGGHAVALVGYRSDGRFIVRNSWGTGWGDKGYAYASESYARAAFTETYGVSM